MTTLARRDVPADLREGAMLDQAFTRATGTPLVYGNRVRLLRDAAENYPAWLDAIRTAQHRIYFENYIFREDEAGLEFAAALSEKARAGVQVRLIYDWMGGLGRTSRRFWRSLRDAGVDVRCFNPPSLMRPFDWLNRDHRKMVAVDGRIGFVTGLCVGTMWLGDAARNVEPWRDTGIEMSGAAVQDIEQAFAQVWATMGDSLPVEENAPYAHVTPAGDIAMRIIASAPGTAGLFRLDQLIAAAARRTLWLTDAYFAGVAPYVQALRAAARDGVDVRLLVPGASDIPLLRPLTQSGYRPLLEAGVRVFEWNGSMLHAKTAVADGRWARVGSSNLNIASWLGNYELDAVVENTVFAGALEKMYEEDLTRATEIVLHPSRTPRLRDAKSGRSFSRHAVGLSRSGGSASRAAAGAMRIGRTVGAALTGQRVLATAEALIVAIFGIVLLAFAVITLLWPMVVVIPLSIFAAWMAIALLGRAYTLRRQRQAREAAAPRL